MPRPSGGMRAGIKRRALAAERDAAYEAAAAEPEAAARLAEAIAQAREWIAASPDDPEMAPRFLLGAQRRLAVVALANEGVPISQRLDGASRYLAAAAKNVDASKLRVELDSLLAQLNQATDGASVDSGEDRTSEETPRH